MPNLLFDNGTVDAVGIVILSISLNFFLKLIEVAIDLKTVLASRTVNFTNPQVSSP
jgi:hypothetical protein